MRNARVGNAAGSGAGGATLLSGGGGGGEPRDGDTIDFGALEIYGVTLAGNVRLEVPF